MNVTVHYLVLDFGGGVKGRVPCDSEDARRSLMDAVLEGGHQGEGEWVVLCSDGERRKLKAAIAGYAVNMVTA